MNIRDRLMDCMEECGVVVNESEEIEEIDSYIYISFIVCLESEFQIEFPDEYLSLDGTKTIQMFCNMIHDLLGSNRK